MAQMPGEPPPPVIKNFGASQTGQNTWKLTGQVVCADPAYLTVTFSGLQGLLDGKTTATDENGNFTFSFYLMTGTSGYVTAQTIDDWCQESEVEEAYVLND